MWIKPSYWPLITTAIIVALLAYGLTQDPRVLPTALKSKQAPHFQLNDIIHPKVEVNESIFQGHYTVVNLWASWCTPCRVEHSLLLKLHERYPHVKWLGINYKDDVDMAKQYLDTLGDPYDVVVADTTGKLGMDWGIYGTPETFLIDKTGHVVHRHAGVLNESIWEKEFAHYIQK